MTRSRCIRPIALVAAVIGVALPSAAAQKLIRTDDLRLDLDARRGLRLRAFDGDLDLRFGGRLHLDVGEITGDLTSGGSFEVRRGRLHAKGRIARDWRFVVDGDLAGADVAGGGGWRSVWVGYEGFDGVSIRVGNLISPMSMSQAIGSNYTTFAERALPDVLAPGFQTGVLVRLHGRVRPLGRAFTGLATGVFVESLGSEDLDRRRSEHMSVAGRLHFAPFARRKRVLHVGASAEYRDVDQGSRFRYRTRGESRLLPPFLDTRGIAGVRSSTTWGAEAAAMWRSLSAQGEYIEARLDRAAGPNPIFEGFYAEVSWFPTGEHRSYSRSSGVFGRVEPIHAWGALQLALRYSEVDLVDAGVLGGRAKDWTAGLAWYPHANLKAAFQYVHVDAERRGDLQREKPHVFQLRLQLFL